MNKKQIRLARLLLNSNQTEFAAMLGWTSKRNVINLERGDKDITIQTSLAIECLLRRDNKFGGFEMMNEIQARLDDQKLEVEKNNTTREEAQDIVFSENDVVEIYLRENNINEDDVDLESLRNLQHIMINELDSQ